MAHHIGLPRHFYQGRAHVIGVRKLFSQNTLTASHKATFMLCIQERILHLLKGTAVNQRTQQGAGGLGCTNTKARIGRFQPGHQLVVDTGVHDQSACRGTALPSGACSGKRHGAYRHVKISRRSNDDGIVATQLEQAAAKACCHRLAYRAAHAGAAGG